MKMAVYKAKFKLNLREFTDFFTVVGCFLSGQQVMDDFVLNLLK